MTRMGGNQPDPMRQELDAIWQAIKRVSAAGLKGHALPPAIFEACRLDQTVAQTGIVTGTWTTLTMDAAGIANNSAMANLASDQIEIKYPGLYLLLGLTEWEGVATGNRFGRFLVTGANKGEVGPLAGTGGARVQCHYLASLVRGDTVKLQGWQDSGANRSTAITNGGSWLAAVWVGVATT